MKKKLLLYCSCAALSLSFLNPVPASASIPNQLSNSVLKYAKLYGTSLKLQKASARPTKQQHIKAINYALTKLLRPELGKVLYPKAAQDFGTNIDKLVPMGYVSSYRLFFSLSKTTKAPGKTYRVAVYFDPMVVPDEQNVYMCAVYNISASKTPKATQVKSYVGTYVDNNGACMSPARFEEYRSEGFRQELDRKAFKFAEIWDSELNRLSMGRTLTPEDYASAVTTGVRYGFYGPAGAVFNYTTEMRTQGTQAGGFNPYNIYEFGSLMFGLDPFQVSNEMRIAIEWAGFCNSYTMISAYAESSIQRISSAKKLGVGATCVS